MSGDPFTRCLCWHLPTSRMVQWEWQISRHSHLAMSSSSQMDTSQRKHQRCQPSGLTSAQQEYSLLELGKSTHLHCITIMVTVCGSAHLSANLSSHLSAHLSAHLCNLSPINSLVCISAAHINISSTFLTQSLLHGRTYHVNHLHVRM